MLTDPAQPLLEIPPPKAALTDTLRRNSYLLFGLVGMMWLVEIADAVAPGSSLDRFGIVARSPAGLIGIVCAPFLHGDFKHLAGNSIPFIVLGGLVLLSGRAKFIEVFVISALAAGLGTWVFAAPGSLHIGASGVVFGFLGFLLLRAWFGRRIGWILIAGVAVLLYGGLILTLFRYQQGISWQGHFFGFAGGVLAAKWHSDSVASSVAKSD